MIELSKSYQIEKAETVINLAKNPSLSRLRYVGVNAHLLESYERISAKYQLLKGCYLFGGLSELDLQKIEHEKQSIADEIEEMVYFLSTDYEKDWLKGMQSSVNLNY